MTGSHLATWHNPFDSYFKKIYSALGTAISGKKVHILTLLRTESRTHLWVKTLRVSTVVPCNRTKAEYASADFASRAQHPCKHKHLFMVTYTHLKIVFGKNPKTILPEDNCNQDLVFWKAKNQTGFSISISQDAV